jgi:protein-arginine kinase
VRLGIFAGRISDIDVAVVNRLFLQLQAGHLQLSSASELTPDQLREQRAALIRRSLG